MSRPEHDTDPETRSGRVGEARDTKLCPYCAETIKAAAIKCRFCQSDLEASPGVEVATGPEPVPTPLMPEGRSEGMPGHAPEPGSQAAPVVRRGRPSGRERRLLVVATAASLVLTLLFCVLAFLAWRDAEDRDAASAAGRAARATVPASLETLLSYEWSTFDEDLEAAAEVMTPSFREEYLPTVEAVRERATEQERTQQATVVAVSVVSEAEDEVETLVFLNRTTFTEDSERQRVLQDRANVTVVRDQDGEWLIDAITFPTS